MLLTAKSLSAILCLLIFSFLSFGYSVNFAYAQADKAVVKSQRINPGSIYYPLKRFWEKSLELVTFTPRGRISYHKMLLEDRLAELKYVADNKLLSEFQQSSERFSYETGILTEMLEELNNADKKKEILQVYDNDAKFLPSLRDQFHANSSFWLLIQQNIDTLNIMSNRLKQSSNGSS